MSRLSFAPILIFAVALAAFEGYFVARKFQPPAARAPVQDLRIIGPIHIGIQLGHHGARFVRYQGPTSVAVGQIPDDVAAAMRQHLRRIPLLVLIEYGLYLAALSIVWLAIASSWRRTESHLLRAGAAMLAVASGALMLQSPIVWGYDSSAFSTWAGPGAVSWSWPGMRISLVPGVSVAQRFVFEAIQVGAWKVLAPIGRWLEYIDIWLSPPTTALRAIAVPALVFGTLAGMIALLSSVTSRYRHGA